MANMLEKVAILQDELDKVAVEKLTSGFMDLNDDLVKYSGGNEVKIPVMTMDGLADYDREKGFVAGSVNLAWKTYEMTQDRGRKFNLDENDVDEANFIPTVSRVAGEFQRTKVVPEIDAYRYSKIASIADEAGKIRYGYSVDENTVLKELYKDLAKVRENYEGEDIVIIMNSAVATTLDLNESVAKKMTVSDFTKGDVSLKIKSLDGEYPIIRVGSSRMKTEYEFLTGKTGQEEGGFKPSDNAKDINWIIIVKRAAIAVNKTDKARVFDPETNQEARAWRYDYRKYHELWIPENKRDGIFVNVKQA